MRCLSTTILFIFYYKWGNDGTGFNNHKFGDNAIIPVVWINDYIIVFLNMNDKKQERTDRHGLRQHSMKSDDNGLLICYNYTILLNFL